MKNIISIETKYCLNSDMTLKAVVKKVKFLGITIMAF